jgi:hypothetical protein
MPHLLVSWKHSADLSENLPGDWNDEFKIEIFEQRVKGWVLGIADLLINTDWPNESERLQPLAHSGFAVLLILFSYFEMIGKYIGAYVGDLDGLVDEETSKKYFKAGVDFVFTERSWQGAGTFKDVGWRDGRCCLYHSINAGPDFFIERRDRVVTQNGPNIIVDPHRLAEGLLENFATYSLPR